MKKQRSFVLFFFCTIFYVGNAVGQNIELYPTHWWVNMKNKEVQLLLKSVDPSFNQSTVSIAYPGVTLNKVHPLDNGKYLALDLTIDASAKPGLVSIEFKQNKKKPIRINWELKARRNGPYAQGVTAKDFIYLAMPDRFSNGDPTNDRVKGMRDQSLHRDSIYHRHGGDLQGIINHLDYLQDLGVTTLWMTPVQENDMPNRTEHGYAITNHYKVDQRSNVMKFRSPIGRFTPSRFLYSWRLCVRFFLLLVHA